MLLDDSGNVYDSDQTKQSLLGYGIPLAKLQQTGGTEIDLGTEEEVACVNPAEFLS